MLNNLGTDQTETASQNLADQNFAKIGNQEMRQQMQNLTLNDLRSELSLSSKGGANSIKHAQAKALHKQKKLKKRRFKEIDKAWDLNMDQ